MSIAAHSSQDSSLTLGYEIRPKWQPLTEAERKANEEVWKEANKARMEKVKEGEIERRKTLDGQRGVTQSKQVN